MSKLLWAYLLLVYPSFALSELTSFCSIMLHKKQIILKVTWTGKLQYYLWFPLFKWNTFPPVRHIFSCFCISYILSKIYLMPSS